MASAALPIYFESSWSILSVIGMWNFFIALTLFSVIGRSKILLVPLIVSLATAISNGMCFYAFYLDYPKVNTAIASGFADFFWMVQEAGLSFYSFVILARWLKGVSRAVFLTFFWSLLLAIVGIRGAILVQRVNFILDSSVNKHRQQVIDHLHSGYFTAIALVELNSAFFLLQNFSRARKLSVRAAVKDSLLGHLMRSTEVRLALLALIGVSRAVTYSFQTSIQSADSVASQIDRFVYTMECLFPIVMFIDILASRLVGTDNSTASVSSRGRSKGPVVRRNGPQTRGAGQNVVSIHPLPTPHKGYDDDYSEDGSKQIELANMTRSMGGGISKTVEFEVYDADGRRTDLHA